MGNKKPTEKTTEKPIHAGHRQRMHERVEAQGFESLAEHEALEYLLYLSIPRGDTNPIAHALLNKFGSLSAVLEADEEELREVDGVGPSSARMLHLLPSVSRYYRCSRARELRRITTSEQLGEYLMAQFHGKLREEALLLSLDQLGRVKRSAWLSAGSADHLSLPVKQVVTEAVRMKADRVVLSHNHPNGVVLPSRQDLIATQELQKGLAMVGVRLIDHVIVTEEEYCSLRQDNRMPFWQGEAGSLLLAAPEQENEPPREPEPPDHLPE